MRGEVIVFYESEITELLREFNIKESEMDFFLECFDNPQDWIHLFVEWLRDQEAEKRG